MTISKYTFDVEVVTTAKITIIGATEEQARSFLENAKAEYICEAMLNSEATVTITKSILQGLPTKD